MLRRGRIKYWQKRESGSTLYIVVVAMVGMLGMSALAIDMVSFYLGRAEAQRAADAAALAGATVFDGERVLGKVDVHVVGDMTTPPLGRGEFAVARIAFDLTARGRWATVVGRVDLPELTLISGDGRTLRRSMVPATAGDGIVVAPAPADAAELESLFRGVSGPEVTALRVEPGPAYRVRRIGLTVFQRENSNREAGRARVQRGLQRGV